MATTPDNHPDSAPAGPAVKPEQVTPREDTHDNVEEPLPTEDGGYQRDDGADA